MVILHKYVFIIIITDEKQALFDGPSKQRKKLALRTNSPFKSRLFKKEYLHIKPLGCIPTQFVDQKGRKTKNYCHYYRFSKIFRVRHKHVERGNLIGKNSSRDSCPASSATNPCSMLIFGIKVGRSYQDISSQADPAREN